MGLYMIEELRIGNKLGFYKAKEKELQIGTVCGLFLDGNTWKIQLREFSQPLTTVGVKPILITEDWLLKFGFEKSNDGYFFHPKENLFEAQTGDYKHFNHCWDGSFTCAKFKYIHQLQNLFFTLTGKEL